MALQQSFRVLLTLMLLGGVPAGAGGADPSLPRRIGADRLHAAGITGRGITVAVIGGAGPLTPEVRRTADGRQRLLAVFDAVAGSTVEWPPAATGERGGDAPEPLLEALLSSRREPGGGYAGVAPNADLVLVRALDRDGGGRPAEVARGVDWVVANRERYGIRVLLLPLAAPPLPGPAEEAPGPAVETPGSSMAAQRRATLRRAVLGAWAAGLVVVAPAGNGGPLPMTVAAPGALPEALTVGAAAASAPAGWQVPLYSAGGPTAEGFVKPEILAPAGGVPAAAAPFADVDAQRAVARAVADSVRRPASGTPLAAAAVGGAVALILEAAPWLGPNEVKHRLVTSARPVEPAAGPPILRQGAGLIDVAAAVAGSGAAAGRSGMTWSDRAARGFVWSDLRGLVWSDAAGSGLVWLDRAGMTWSDLEVPVLPRRSGENLGMTWSD